MSDDPKRWLEDGGGSTDAERALLRSGGEVEPSAGAREAMWAALATRLPPAGGGGSPPDPTAPPGGGGPGLAVGGSSAAAKTLAILVVGAVVAIGAVATLRSPSTPSIVAPLASSTPVAPPPPVAAVSGPGQDSPPAPIAIAIATATATAEPAPSHRPARPPTGPIGTAAPVATASVATIAGTDALRDESALVGAARAAVRRGDGAAALASLDLARARHPHGVLLQEREVLTIEALAQKGDTDTASRRATAFLRAFPTSPHVAHVRTFVR